MKNKFTLFTVAISLILMAGVLSPQGLMAQQTDQSQILKKIIGLSELQNYYPVNAGVEQVYISQSPVSFPDNLKLSIPGKKITFMKESELKANGVKSFFRFRSFEVDQTSSTVICHFFSNYNFETTKSDILAITVNLEKSGSDWKVVNSNVKGVK